MIFCCWASGPSSADGGMFLRISWCCVMNVVTDMRMMRTIVTTCACQLSAPMNLSESCAPKIVERSA